MSLLFSHTHTCPLPRVPATLPAFGAQSDDSPIRQGSPSKTPFTLLSPDSSQEQQLLDSAGPSATSCSTAAVSAAVAVAAASAIGISGGDSSVLDFGVGVVGAGISATTSGVQDVATPKATHSAATTSSVSMTVPIGSGRSVSALEALRKHGVMSKVLCTLSVEELLGETPAVCRAWRKAATLAFAEVASRMEDGDEVVGIEEQEEKINSARERERYIHIYPVGFCLWRCCYCTRQKVRPNLSCLVVPVSILLVGTNNFFSHGRLVCPLPQPPPPPHSTHPPLPCLEEGASWNLEEGPIHIIAAIINRAFCCTKSIPRECWPAFRCWGGGKG